MTYSRIESFRLSTGQLVELNKFGRKYNVMVTNDDDAPTMHHNLSKAEAYAIYEEIIKTDTLS